MAAFLVYEVVLAWQDPDRVFLSVIASWAFAVGSFFALIALLGNRIEVRARGVILAGNFLAWRRIRSYTWETTDKGILLLRIKITRYPGRWPMRVPPHAKDALAAILEQQILEWPERPAEDAPAVSAS